MMMKLQDKSMSRECHGIGEEGESSIKPKTPFPIKNLQIEGSNGNSRSTLNTKRDHHMTSTCE